MWSESITVTPLARRPKALAVPGVFPGAVLAGWAGGGKCPRFEGVIRITPSGLVPRAARQGRTYSQKPKFLDDRWFALFP